MDVWRLVMTSVPFAVLQAVQITSELPSTKQQGYLQRPKLGRSVAFKSPQLCIMHMAFIIGPGHTYAIVVLNLAWSSFINACFI